jgi:signal peptidase II
VDAERAAWRGGTGHAGAARARSRARGARQLARTLAAAAAVVALDQTTKALALNALSPGSGRPLVGRLVTLTLVENRGAAFGLLGGAAPELAAFALAVAAGILWWSARSERPAIAWALGLVLGGALGNLADRLLRHAVVDFVNVHVWPVFNVADAAITLGATALVALGLGLGDAGDDRGRGFHPPPPGRRG